MTLQPKAGSQTVIDRLLDHLIRKLGEELLGVWLYGSFASGDVRPDSDIDLAVLTCRPLPEDRLRELALELMDLGGRDVDLVDLRRAPTVLAMQVISSGRRLYCRDRFACELFETHVFSDYVDLNERRAGILQDIRQRGSVYG
ncbi:type II toxin-antitoxin system antitoxin [Methylothermus subterraneus]